VVANYGTVAIWWLGGRGWNGCWRHGDSEQRCAARCLL